MRYAPAASSNLFPRLPLKPIAAGTHNVPAASTFLLLFYIILIYLLIYYSIDPLLCCPIALSLYDLFPFVSFDIRISILQRRIHLHEVLILRLISCCYLRIGINGIHHLNQL